jgi:hypothetical protein
MPAADYQLFVFDLRVIAKDNIAFAIRRSFDSINISNSDQHAAMYADEIATEFLGERFQRFVYQVAAVLVIDRYVFLIRAKAMYVFDRYQPEIAVRASADVPSCDR